jgi:DNA-binding transcriptional LysR family regulator
LPHALELANLADKVISAWDHGIKRIHRQATEPAHFVLIGPALFLREVVLPWWNQVSSEFSDMELEVQVSSLERVSLETLKTGADVGVLEHKEELPEFVCKQLYVERWGLVRNPAVHYSPTQLNKYFWGTYSPLINPVDTWLVRRQKMSQPIFKFYWQDLTAIARWIAETHGAASVLPWHSVVNYVKQGRLVFEPLPEATSTLYMAYKKNSLHQRFLKRFTKISEFDLALAGKSPSG